MSEGTQNQRFHGAFDVLYRSPVSKMWDGIALATEHGHSVTTDLLRQRHDVYESRKKTFGEMADFVEALEIMTRLETGTGKVLRDIG